MVTLKNPQVKPVAIPGTGGDISFKKKPSQTTRTVMLNMESKQDILVPGQDVSLAQPQHYLQRGARDSGLGKELEKRNSPVRTQSQEKRSIKPGCLGVASSDK